MIAANNPVPIVRTGQRTDHVVNRFDVPVGSNFQVNSSWSRTDVIGNGQGSAPIFWSDWALECRQKWQGIRVRNWKYRNLGNGLRFLDRKPFCVGRRSDAWSQGIARIVRVHYAAALYSIAGAPASGGIIVALEESVALGIGVDDAPDGSVLGGDF